MNYGIDPATSVARSAPVGSAQEMKATQKVMRYDSLKNKYKNESITIYKG